MNASADWRIFKPTGSMRPTYLNIEKLERQGLNSETRRLIFAYCVEKDMTYKALAEGINMSSSVVQRYMSGYTKHAPKLLKLLAEFIPEISKHIPAADAAVAIATAKGRAALHKNARDKSSAIYKMDGVPPFEHRVWPHPQPKPQEWML